MRTVRHDVKRARRRHWRRDMISNQSSVTDWRQAGTLNSQAHSGTRPTHAYNCTIMPLFSLTSVVCTRRQTICRNQPG